MLTTKNEKEFLDKLDTLHWHVRKLVLGYRWETSNRLQVCGELRRFPTVGGYQYALAEINFIGQRGSGIYSNDPETIYLHAIDLEKRNSDCTWFEVDDCEHTPDKVY